VRNASITHLTDADQRTVELPIVSKSGGNVKVSVTDNKAVLPAGPYMLFINKGSDKGLIPSVSRQVYVGAALPEYLRTSAVGSAQVQGVQVARPQVGGGTLPSTGADSTPAVAGLTLLVLAGLGGALRRKMQVR
jgi:LPXTG-motif cell wall-anchored protein